MGDVDRGNKNQGEGGGKGEADQGNKSVGVAGVEGSNLGEIRYQEICQALIQSWSAFLEVKQS